MLLIDLGLALVLVALAMLMIWRLADLFKKRGHWAEELEETGYCQTEYQDPEFSEEESE
jgi:hypothetical protein